MTIHTRTQKMDCLRTIAIISLLWIILPASSLANTIYKCRKDDKVIFTQTVCPEEFSQHKIEYQLGVTTETDLDKRTVAIDPLQALLNQQTLPKDKLVQLIEAENYRLTQENSYFEILRANELQKLERKSYWQNTPKDNPQYQHAENEINLHFDKLIVQNQTQIQALTQRKQQVLAETPVRDTQTTTEPLK